jgi:hypothetical protein
MPRLPVYLTEAGEGGTRLRLIRHALRQEGSRGGPALKGSREAS